MFYVTIMFYANKMFVLIKVYNGRDFGTNKKMSEMLFTQKRIPLHSHSAIITGASFSEGTFFIS